MNGRRLRVRGLVQGVGFRPLVWRLARELGLVGWVRNDGQGVDIEIGGATPARLDDFLERLHRELPPLARIDAIEQTPCAVDHADFVILESGAGTVDTAIGPDAAPCPACLGEICDPANRRWRYAFTTCTHCGPRYTVSAGLPYDRVRTTLNDFPLCPACTREYADPADRRFHAETTCCPMCGPRLRFEPLSGGWPAVDAQRGADPLAQTVAALRAGQIVAIKGLGGFQLACDARNPAAVAELRRRKGREAKPLAVMALNPASLAGLVAVDAGSLALLRSPATPIVLCSRGAVDLPGIADGLAEIGVMLPASPLHHLLWHEAAGRPAGTAWLEQAHPLWLVMTSANPGGEPLVIDNDEAARRLAGLADALLVHDRAIIARCDDSVVRPGVGVIRRARGFVPEPIPLLEEGPSVLALGAYLKNTLCLVRGREAFLSTHIGSLDNAATLAFQEETLAHLQGILAVQPARIACDLHPDFPSSQLAQRLGEAWSVPVVPVAHHHAHIAAVCAEHGVRGPVLGLAIDGVGLGPDGGLWGGELLAVDGPACRRIGHLHPLPLPGGERAAREPWRMALAALFSAGQGERARDAMGKFPARLAGHDPARVLSMLARNVNCPLTSSLGRVFDAAAALLGVCQVSAYEGQAAMALEALASRHGPAEPLAAWAVRDGILDLRPLLLALSEFADPAAGAAVFHATLAVALENWVLSAVDREKTDKIVIAGGCAQNRLLLAGLRDALVRRGLSVHSAVCVPANDGGIALGQAWVARLI